MNRIKYYCVGNQMFCETRSPITNNIVVFSTNTSGMGLWLSAHDYMTGESIVERKQIKGNAQFSIRGLKPESQKSKLRKFIKKYFVIYYGSYEV